jgi:hypothetical protein
MVGPISADEELEQTDINRLLWMPSMISFVLFKNREELLFRAIVENSQIAVCFWLFSVVLGGLAHMTGSLELLTPQSTVYLSLSYGASVAFIISALSFMPLLYLMAVKWNYLRTGQLKASRDDAKLLAALALCVACGTWQALS